MREPYEPPAIDLLGSITELTQANLFGQASDNLLVLRGPADDVYS
ncbi:MAG: lasso RiPP family leader peptide-containing protein [Sciscionella sp.]